MIHQPSKAKYLEVAASINNQGGKVFSGSIEDSRIHEIAQWLAVAFNAGRAFENPTLVADNPMFIYIEAS